MKTESSSSLFFSLLTVLLIGLKLTDHIDWPWWWVLSPLWIPAAVLVAIMAILVVLAALCGVVAWGLRRCGL